MRFAFLLHPQPPAQWPAHGAALGNSGRVGQEANRCPRASGEHAGVTGGGAVQPHFLCAAAILPRVEGAGRPSRGLEPAPPPPPQPSHASGARPSPAKVIKEAPDKG